jgi:hypothetical protein
MSNVRIVSGRWVFDERGREVVRVLYLRDGVSRVVYAASMSATDVTAAIDGDAS